MRELEAFEKMWIVSLIKVMIYTKTFMRDCVGVAQYFYYLIQGYLINFGHFKFMFYHLKKLTETTFIPVKHMKQFKLFAPILNCSSK